MAETQPSGRRSISLEVVQADILTFRADVAAFKYAQQRYGADAAAARALTERGVPAGEIEPTDGEASLVQTRGAIASSWALFVGTPPGRKFRYASIRRLSSATLEELSARLPDAQHVVTTIHGPGFGMDEVEAILSQVAGFVEAMMLGNEPRELRRITIVDRQPKRVDLIQETLAKHAREIPGGFLRSNDGHRWTFGARRQHDAVASGARSDGLPQQARGGLLERTPDERNHLFVALPFDDRMRDLFRYGIQNPARNAGFLCEHMGDEAFVGDVVDQIKEKIETARAVIGVLTGSNPNVFLEIGYSWGVRRPTILVSEEGGDNPFDVRGQRHIRYRNIGDLEDKLTRELSDLRQQGVI
jgi:hypothetical protein